jgi:hypothetical protein
LLRGSQTKPAEFVLRMRRRAMTIPVSSLVTMRHPPFPRGSTMVGIDL